MNRIYYLDYLRGLAAFGVMIYHYLSWTFGYFSTETVIERIGVYGVAVFYVLSGLTLFHVYHDKMLPSKGDLKDFFRKRAFRILPLLWLVTLLSIIKERQIPDLLDVSLNLTGLFGIFRWDKYFATGAWSIGNELVFYLFFPFFILFLKKSKLALALLSLLLFSIYIYFAFFILDKNIPIGLQWKDYVNPLNQIFLFLSGFLIGAIFKDIQVKQLYSLFILITGVCLFIFYPIRGTPVDLVTGIARLVFTSSCLLICLSFYKFSMDLPNAIHQPLKYLGDMSYSVYLMHPLVFTLFKYSNGHLYNFSSEVTLGLSISTTFIVSYLIYEYYEKYFMKIGRKKPSAQIV